MLLGGFRPIDEDSRKFEALKAFVEAVVPGLWSEVSAPSRQELKGTAVLGMELSEASVKTKTGGPGDDDSPDATIDIWAGVLPLITGYGPPAPALRPRTPLAPSLRRVLRAAASGTAVGFRDRIRSVPEIDQFNGGIA